MESYLKSLNDKQRIAIELAKKQLKTSYTMEKSNGFIQATRPGKTSVPSQPVLGPS
jgi:hypothetical protein